MKIIEHRVKNKEQEAVTLEYVELTQTFRDIRDYCLGKSKTILGYTENKDARQILLGNILYIEAVGEKVFFIQKMTFMR